MRQYTRFLFCLAAGILPILTACEGLFGGIYDDPPEAPPAVVREGQLYIDASAWTTWTYIDFDALTASDTPDLDAAICVMDIPSEGTGPQQTEHPDTELPGRYNYWFDVFGVGMANTRLEYFLPTAQQPEPDRWDIAIHREVARTNGGTVFETALSSMDDLPPTSAAFARETFTPDTWSERDVWVWQDQLLMGITGCQGIAINRTLSDWYTCNLPPVPPTYEMNDHVFIVRLEDGRCAALQLVNHLSPKGTKCCFTINYRFPY